MIGRRPPGGPADRSRRCVRTGAILLALSFAVAPLEAQSDRAPRRPPPRYADTEPPAIAGAVSVALPPADPDGGLAGAFYYLEDSTGELSYEEVSRGAAASRFRLSARDRLNLGFTSAALWPERWTAVLKSF